MKKIIVCFVCILMLATSLSLPVFAATTVASGNCGADGSNVTWVLDDTGTLTISGTGRMEDFYRTPWQNHGTAIKNVIISSGVTNVGGYAFYNCTSLTSVTIGNSVTSIGYASFRNCTNLSSIAIPNSVTNIGTTAFQGCRSLTSITIPDSVTSIGVRAFFDCSGLTSVTLPPGVRNINLAFEKCTLYAPDSRTIEVFKCDTGAWQSVGWYTYPVTTMYAADGRSAVIASSDVEAWKSVGWYLEPVTIVYAPDGRTEVIAPSDAEAWTSVGWYLEPVTIVYAPDGRTEVIYSKDAAAWISVGWRDLNAEKAAYDFNSIDSIVKYLQRFYPAIVTEVGNFDLTYSYYLAYPGVYEITIECPLEMTRINFLHEYKMEERESANLKIEDFMYTLANDVIRRTSLPLKFKYNSTIWNYEFKMRKDPDGYKTGSYEKTTRAGATYGYICKNYRTNYVTGADGYGYSQIEMTGFEWDFLGWKKLEI